jgi:hypothetical protein
MDKRGCIIVTYRDRRTHLDAFLLYMNRYFPQYPIIVAEQVDSGPWNKGLLYNAAYKEAAYEYDYLILHDVDWIPDKTVDYSYCNNPTMIGGAASQFNYQLIFPTFFGGVVVCSKEHYEIINGFSNRYRGYGGEDCDFRNSFIGKGIITEVKMGRFECFTHPKPDINIGSSFWNSPDYQNNWKLVHQPRDYTDGLSDARYYITSDTKHPECRHIRIKTDL